MEIGIVGLLRAAWLAGTFPLIVASLPFPGLNWFHARIMGFTLRGKTMLASNRFTVPQLLFSHFYLVGVLWTSLLLGATWMYAHNEETVSTGTIFLFCYCQPLDLGFRGAFMKVYMSSITAHSAPMHIMGYSTGIFFCKAAPLLLRCNIIPDVLTYWEDLIFEFIARGKAQMPPVEYNLWEFFIPLIKLGWRHWIGTAISLWGWIHQHRCHKILGSLRENREQSEEYVIPHGDWFQIVSCPHYLAEIVTNLMFTAQKPMDGISISLRIIPRKVMPSSYLIAEWDRSGEGEVDRKY